MLLHLKLITKENIQKAIEIEHIIFPKYSAYYNYLESLNDKSHQKFYLIYNDNICIGTTGIYYYKDDTLNAWI